MTRPLNAAPEAAPIPPDPVLGAVISNHPSNRLRPLIIQQVRRMASPVLHAQRDARHAGYVVGAAADHHPHRDHRAHGRLVKFCTFEIAKLSCLSATFSYREGFTDHLLPL